MKAYNHLHLHLPTDKCATRLQKLMLLRLFVSCYNTCFLTNTYAMQMSVPDAQLAQLDELEGSWAAFRSCLDETATSLERAKDSFRDKLVQMVDTFATEVVVSRDMFTQDAPFSNEVTCTAST